MITTIYPVNRLGTCEMGIVDFYDNLSVLMYGKTYDHYDCTKVYVGKAIQNDIFEYYKRQGKKEEFVSMLWVCYGPKATLEGYEVECENDWATNDT